MSKIPHPEKETKYNRKTCFYIYHRQRDEYTRGQKFRMAVFMVKSKQAFLSFAGVKNHLIQVFVQNFFH